MDFFNVALPTEKHINTSNIHINNKRKCHINILNNSINSMSICLAMQSAFRNLLQFTN